jgi:hypothetical protein
LTITVAPGHPAIGSGGVIVQASAPTYSEPTAAAQNIAPNPSVPSITASSVGTGSITNTVPPPSPASFVNELKNPATWATIAAYIPTFWGIFNLPGKGLPVALGIVHIAAILAGPIATVAYAIAHAMKAASHESRLAQIEAAAVAAFAYVEREPNLLVTDVKEDLLSVINAFRPAPKSLGISQGQ